MRKLLNLGIALSLSATVCAQTISIEGYVFETNNRGYINGATIKVEGNEAGALRGSTETNAEGFFSLEVPVDTFGYRIAASENLFFSKNVIIQAKEVKAGKKIFTKIELERRPGYIFDVTLAENNKAGLDVVDAIEGARVEIYNQTTKEEVLALLEHPSPNFNFTFERGNHYTLMIRKKGFLNKRIEAFVNIDGCIMCFEGVNNITEVMTKGNEMGTFLGNVELDPIAINTTFELKNIYYDYDESYIREDASKELDKVVQVLKDNPAITVELGSHTDSRGKDAYNRKLSDARAAAAVAYLVQNGIGQNRLVSKGYGESVLINQCRNGIDCSEEDHQRNRRTELKILGIEKEDPLDKKTLKQIIEEDKLLEEIYQSPEIRIKEGEELPEELKKQLKGGN